MIFRPKAFSVVFFSFESDVVDSSCVMIDKRGLMFLIVVVMVCLLHLRL